jgi:hypothetical protein
MSGTPAMWTDAFLDAMRRERDEVAGAVVDAVYASGDLDGVNQVLVQLVRHGPPLAPALQASLDRYFATTAALPAWTDPAKIARAEALFSRHGMLATSILCCASLPECYLDRDGVPVLASTQRLSAHVYRRIWETSHMIISVMQPGGLTRASAGGDGAPPGVNYCQRVRLMHGAIAHLLLAPSVAVGTPDQLGHALAQREWNANLGVPLNQEDLAYVLLTFSYVGLRGLVTLGVTVNDEEREAYVHAWNVVGALLGIRDELLAGSHADAKTLFDTIKRRRRGASAEGQALTRSLLAWMEDVMPPELRHLPAQLLCALIGDDDAALLGVQRGTLDRIEEHAVVALLRVLSHVVDDIERHSPVRRTAEALFRALVQKIWSDDSSWQGELFALPPALQQSWALSVPGRPPGPPASTA